VVIPNSVENATGNPTWNLFNNENQVIQLLINQSQLTDLNGQEIGGISFRLPGLTSPTYPVLTPWPLSSIIYGNFDVYLSEGVSLDSSSSVFADNVVGTQTQVRSEELIIDPEVYTTGDPANFGPIITFDTPYLYSGGNLLLEIRHSSSDYSVSFSPVNAISSSTHPDYGVNVKSVINLGGSFNATTGLANVYNTPVVRFTEAGPPATCPKTSPISTSNETFTSVDVSWTAGGTETLWDIQWGTGDFNPNTNTGIAEGSQNGLTTPNYSITGLTADTNYRIFVRADCGNGNTSVWKLKTFRSGHCVPSGLTTSQTYYISAFTTTDANIDLDYSATSGLGYVDATATPFSVSPGLSFDWSISASSGNNYFYIWVDWNNNMEFEPSERIYAPTTLQSSPVTGTYTIDPMQPDGTYRMRVANSWTTNTLNPCGANTYGNYVDFDVNVGLPPSCMPVGTLTTSNVTFTSVDVSWTAGGTETLWDIQWGTGNFNPNTNTGTAEESQNGLTTPNYSITGLTPDTDYRVYVRADCGNGDTSVWKLKSFYSGHCKPSSNATTSDYTADFHTSGAITDVQYGPTTTNTTGGYANLYSTQAIVQSAGSSFDIYHMFHVSWSSSVRI